MQRVRRGAPRRKRTGSGRCGFEFQVDGVHVDPLGLKLPMADPIAQNEKQRFLQLSQPLMAQMDQERATMLAMKTE